jgi:hypothetical protein
MPYTFDGLKKQRFRWCFGGIQILKKHWNSLMPWAHWLDPKNRLTLAQRYFYLVGGLQWFTDVLNLLFGVFLSLGAIASVFYGLFSVRPLTGPLLIVPALFLFLHLWRFLWVLRKSLHLPARVALRSMYNFFSLGWVVTLACIEGIIRKKGVFLRTPKSKSQSKVLGALRVTQWETSIGLLFLGCGLVAFIARPEWKTGWLGFLLAWQASLFLAAPYYSVLSIQAGPVQSMQPLHPQHGTAVAETSTAKWAWAAMAMTALIMWAVFQLPQPQEPPTYAVYQPVEVPPAALFEIDDTATPSPSPTPTSMPPSNTNTPPGTTASQTPNATPTFADTATPPPTEPTEPTESVEPTSENSATTTATPTP